MNLKAYLNNEERNFYLLLLLSIITIFFINPFLKYPYDIYTHLQWIDHQNNDQLLPKGRETWHYIWSRIFHFFYIDRTEVFLRAHIIHFTQIIISFLSLLYFSRVMMRNLFPKIQSSELNYLSYWSTLIWFTLFATYSVNHHQVWILWYSVNYQISLIFTLLITGLSISFILDPLSMRRRISYIFLILFFSYVILRIHAMEYIYYLMYMGVLALVFIDKIIILWRKKLYYSIPLTLIFIFIFIQFIQYIKTYVYRQSPVLNYLSFEKLPDLLSKINSKGQLLLSHYNRASNSINELMYLSLILIFLLFLIVIYRYIKKYPSPLNIRLGIFLFITSLFIVIPLTKLTGGIASLITYTTVAHRFYYSSLLFLILPSVIFYIYSILNIKKVYILNISIFILLVSTFFYSKHISTTHNYYKNIISIKNAFNKKKMSFNLSDKEITLIGTQLKHHESLNKTQKKAYYYARDDIAFVIKFIYRKPVQYYRRGSKNYQKSFHVHKNKKYYPILFETPENFPSYQRFK